MLLGLSITMLIVGASSWWLAKLAMQPIYDSYRQIQQFTGDAAHELRTPLAAIQATIESTLRISQLSDSEARETLQVVKRQDAQRAFLGIAHPYLELILYITGLPKGRGLRPMIFWVTVIAFLSTISSAMLQKN
ncbi:MAG: hypothetical protein BRC59_12365 [Cyanobacteria bacterium SW_4_48_29]|nr:MAG: hypothetical protein BRC59_12365 [Cyanobacteria bacterium SW_4_48_29]